MQTYNPIRGMTVCVSGGEYVERKDAENKIAALEKRVKEVEAENQRLRAALEKEVTFDDAPCEYDNSEAYAWANGYSTAIGVAREALEAK